MKKLLLKILLAIFISIILMLFFIKPIDSFINSNKSPEIIITNKDHEELIRLINNNPITPIEIDKLNPNYINYLIYIEDRAFYSHSGFNLQRIGKSIFSNLFNSKKMGASTITQQYIKNMYLDNSKRLSRKLKEIYLSIKLEQLLSKNEILENYLNCIYFGNNIYGLANAAKYYFDKNYFDLTPNEMTSLIVLLNAPSHYSDNINQWNKQKDKLADILYSGNIISFTEYNNIKRNIILNINKHIYPSNLMYYVDAVVNEYNTINKPNKFNSKIIISTHYSKEINDISFDIQKGNYASIAIDKDGFIVSCIGDIDYYSSPFNIALNGKRDIGSTIKPLLYYEALRCGYTTSKKHFSAPFSFKYKNEIITIKNYSNNYPNSEIDMKTALAVSDNIYAIKTHLNLGMKTLANHFKKYNIAALPIPSLALGSVGMSLYDLIEIYSQFFSDGYMLTLNFIDKIIVDNKIIYEQKTNKKALGNAEYFKQIKDIMSGTFDPNISNSTCGHLNYLLKNKCYGKSGLTDYDSYMIGFNEDVLVAVWSGFLDNSILDDHELKRLPKTVFIKQINAFN